MGVILKGLKQWWLASADIDDDILLARKQALVRSIVKVGTFVFSSFALFNALQGYYHLAIAGIIETSLFFLAYYLSVKKSYHQLAFALLVAIFFVFLPLFIFLHKGNGLVAMIWTLFFPLCVVELLGTKRGIAICVAFYAMLIPLCYGAIGYWPDEAWNVGHFLRFTAASFCMVYIAYIMRSSYNMSYQRLLVAREKEQVIMQNKDQLMVDISHELRTPLSVLKLQLEALEYGIDDKEKSCEILHRKLGQLDRVIQDLYMLSKAEIEPLKIEQSQFDFSSFIDDLLRSYQKLAEQRGLTLTFDFEGEMEALVYADRERLNQVFFNLLNNSLYYTEAPGKIEVSVANIGTEIVVVLSDSAPGVSDQELPKLKDRLFRVDKSRSRATGGSGLGLAICEVIVEAHQGSVNIDHSHLGGLSIEVRLPLLSESQA